MKTLTLFCLLVASVLGRKGFGPTDQDWGYVDVRDGAHMFWWLHYTTADVADVTDRPLVIWLQGGPGASSTGYGNFGELGPLDADLNLRNTTWVKDVNVLFVDNPVGTGFSYVDDRSMLTKTNRQIANDFLAFLKGFYKQNSKFLRTPLYILCESYGGKMTAEIALVLQQAIVAGEIECSFKGVGLGDSWISPIDSVMTWAPYLLHFGAIDSHGYKAIQEQADKTKKALDQGLYEEATDLWSDTEIEVFQATYGVDFYNVLSRIPSYFRHIIPRSPLFKPDDDLDAKIAKLMASKVPEALNLTQTWGAQRGLVFSRLSGDFMKPVTNIVEELLNTTDLKVVVYNGQLDLIVDTPGTVLWVDNLNWTRRSEWDNAPRDGFTVDGIYEGYVKKVGNFAMYWVDRAGHMVPADNPAAMDYILKDLTNNYNYNKTTN